MSPKAAAFWFETAQWGQVIGSSDAGRSGFLLIGTNHPTPAGRTIAMSANPAEYARALYAALRELDSDHVERIYIEMPPDSPNWAAIRDRLVRASKAFIYV